MSDIVAPCEKCQISHREGDHIDVGAKSSSGNNWGYSPMDMGMDMGNELRKPSEDSKALDTSETMD